MQFYLSRFYKFLHGKKNVLKFLTLNNFVNNNINETNKILLKQLHDICSINNVIKL